MQSENGIYVGLNANNKDWKFIPNTPEALEQAIAEGYRSRSLMSFEYEYSADKPEPNRKGNLFIDFDNHSEPYKAIIDARKFCELLHTEFDVDLNNLRYWLSGSKGCHIEIPSEIYGDAEGDSYLPKIHKTMVHMLAAKSNIGSIDTFIYKMKRGQLIRMENIQRDDKRYKVPITLDEFMNINTNDIQHLTSNKRDISINNGNDILQSEKLTCIFENVKNMYRFAEDEDTAIEALLGCDFIFYCLTYDGILPEKQQELICSIFSKLGDKGMTLFNNLFKGKISDSSNNIKTTNCSCANIKKIHSCDKDCSIKGPYDLVKEYRKHAYDINRNYRDGYDGLYYLTDPENNRSIKLCSSLKVLGKVRDEKNAGWSRYVEIETPDGTVNRIKVSMKDLITSQNNTIGELVDNGLEICSQSPKAFQLIKEYISYGGSNDKIILDPRITGWIDSPLSTYALPDELITAKETVYTLLSGNTDHKYKTSGTLEDWINNVGKLCVGNDILILVTSYALTGPLLRIANAEGGGLHICGGSSTGKTSIAAVAGSICGSDGQKGYMYQWRMTDNSLERIATLHNDNFLVLDEISQATSETVNDVTYMLTNGQGKFRLKSDATPKQAYKWMLNYLSTGEITIDAKIKENPKHKPLAGQAVRVIDLPIDKGRNDPTFSQIHGSKDPAAFSNVIKQNSLNYYGTPLREFIRKIIGNYGYLNFKIEKIIDSFKESVCDGIDAEGQVQRVARKFGLIAAAGELAIEFGILPYQKNDALNAAAEWFRVWIEQRGSSTNLEITTQIQILKDHFDRYSETNYLDLKYNRSINNQLYGYKFRDQSENYRYLMITAIFNDLFSRYNKRQVLNLFVRKGFLELGKDGEPKQFKKIAGMTRRGYIFIPQNWADPVESDDDK